MTAQNLHENVKEGNKETRRYGMDENNAMFFRTTVFPGFLVSSAASHIKLQLEMLQLYRDLGLAVFPLKWGSKNSPMVKWGSLKFDEAYWTRLHDMASKQPLNLAVVCGSPSGNLTVLDFESMELCEKILPKWRILIQKTVAVKPSRGIHIYLRSSQLIRSRAIRSLGLDVKAEGGYVLAPPSLHQCDMFYRHVGGKEILMVEKLEVDLTKLTSRLTREKMASTQLREAYGPVENMPPCLKLLKTRLQEDLSVEDPHWLRFAFASLLIAKGASLSQIQLEFSKLPKYEPTVVAYQVMHIERGLYKPPSCKSLAEHGCCRPNKLCLALRRRHPLSYINLFNSSLEERRNAKEVNG